ncbi:MAG: FkbM family methyltransferase [Chloroflexi bacterium]|nr:FkbM family methyltransferase [Chloroflexota bacterium]
MRLPPDFSIYWEAQLAGDTYEPGVTRVFEKLLGPGMVVVDVGAHVGYYTLLAARKVGPSGRVYAFEPEPANYRLLLENITLNGYRNVTAEQVAVSDNVGTATLYVDRLFSKNHSLVRSGPRGDEATISVATITLDDFLERQGSPQVHLIKMDIDGNEPLTLRGMAGLLAKSPCPRLVVELNLLALRAAGITVAEFLEQLERLSLRVWVVDPKEGALHPLRDVPYQRLLREGANLLCSASVPW